MTEQRLQELVNRYLKITGQHDMVMLKDMIKILCGEDCIEYLQKYIEEFYK